MVPYFPQGYAVLFSIIALLAKTIPSAICLNIVIPGGTGPLGRKLASDLGTGDHDVTILTRNSFLASASSRVSTDFGWVGQAFLAQNDHVRLRDYDGGDLLDIVGKDWVGWQEDALKGADVIVNLVGGYTEQRVMATERIVRESLRVNPSALQVTVSPVDEDVPRPQKLTLDRIRKCEEMVKANCQKAVCLRFEMNDIDASCKKIIDAIDKASN